MHTISEPTNTPIIPAIPESLAEMALQDMRRTFRTGLHWPSPGQWDAIGDYLDHAEHAANGTLKQAVYLSAIPAGTGKSVAVAAFARALAAHPSYEDVGVLIAVNRITEASDMADALQPWRSRLALIVGDGKHASSLRANGDHAEAEGAQIVVTTHALLKQTMRHTRDFNDATRYFYRGQRRRVVLWDEQIAFNRPVVLDQDAVAGLARAIRRQSREAVVALHEWVASMNHSPAGLCSVPDFGAMGVDFAKLEQDVEADDQAVAQARALAVISGETGHVLRSNSNAASLVTHVPELPATLMPVLVTDASAARGVHHASYDMMSTNRPVIRTTEATKTYRNLTIRVVPKAASRSTYRKAGCHDARDLVDMMVSYIRRAAPEPVLVVSYKGQFNMHGVKERTIASAIDARLSDAERGRVSHLLWGSHNATNDHKTTARVVFAGLNFMPPAATYAASGAALGKSMRTTSPMDHPTGDQVKDMERGMLRDSTLQAVLRGAARIGVDGDCGTQEVVIPQAPQTGLSTSDYQGMFPSCTIIRDVGLMPPKPLKGNLQKVAKVVLRHHEAGAHEVSDPSIYGELGMTCTEYGRLKRRDAWGPWLGSIGWHQAKLGGGIMGIRRGASMCSHP